MASAATTTTTTTPTARYLGQYNDRRWTTTPAIRAANTETEHLWNFRKLLDGFSLSFRSCDVCWYVLALLFALASSWMRESCHKNETIVKSVCALNQIVPIKWCRRVTHILIVAVAFEKTKKNGLRNKAKSYLLTY